MLESHPTHSTASSVRFGDFCFNLETLELWCEDSPVALAPKPALVLASLLREPGRLINRRELYKTGWNDAHLSVDLALNTAVRQIRKALGDSATEPRFLQTVPRRGYRFVATVTKEDPDIAHANPHRTVRPNPFLRHAALASPFFALVVAVVFVWHLFAEAPAVAIAPVRFIDGTVDRVTGDLLEERIRNAVARSAGGSVAVLANSDDAKLLPAAYVVQGSLHSVAPGSPRFEVQVVRTEDHIIIWSGSFNPHCPTVADPVGFIADYVARLVVKRIA